MARSRWIRYAGLTGDAQQITVCKPMNNLRDASSNVRSMLHTFREVGRKVVSQRLNRASILSCYKLRPQVRCFETSRWPYSRIGIPDLKNANIRTRSPFHHPYLS